MKDMSDRINHLKQKEKRDSHMVSRTEFINTVQNIELKPQSQDLITSITQYKHSEEMFKKLDRKRKIKIFPFLDASSRLAMELQIRIFYRTLCKYTLTDSTDPLKDDEVDSGITALLSTSSGNMERGVHLSDSQSKDSLRQSLGLKRSTDFTERELIEYTNVLKLLHRHEPASYNTQLKLTGDYGPDSLTNDIMKNALALPYTVKALDDLINRRKIKLSGLSYEQLSQMLWFDYGITNASYRGARNQPQKVYGFIGGKLRNWNEVISTYKTSKSEDQFVEDIFSRKIELRPKDRYIYELKLDHGQMIENEFGEITSKRLQVVPYGFNDNIIDYNGKTLTSKVRQETSTLIQTHIPVIRKAKQTSNPLVGMKTRAFDKKSKSSNAFGSFVNQPHYKAMLAAYPTLFKVMTLMAETELLLQHNIRYVEGADGVNYDKTFTLFHLKGYGNYQRTKHGEIGVFLEYILYGPIFDFMERGMIVDLLEVIGQLKVTILSSGLYSTSDLGRGGAIHAVSWATNTLDNLNQLEQILTYSKIDDVLTFLDKQIHTNYLFIKDNSDDLFFGSDSETVKKAFADALAANPYLKFSTELSVEYSGTIVTDHSHYLERTAVPSSYVKNLLVPEYSAGYYDPVDKEHKGGAKNTIAGYVDKDNTAKGKQREIWEIMHEVYYDLTNKDLRKLLLSYYHEDRDQVDYSNIYNRIFLADPSRVSWAMTEEDIRKIDPDLLEEVFLSFDSEVYSYVMNLLSKD